MHTSDFHFASIFFPLLQGSSGMICVISCQVVVCWCHKQNSHVLSVLVWRSVHRAEVSRPRSNARASWPPWPSYGWCTRSHALSAGSSLQTSLTIPTGCCYDTKGTTVCPSKWHECKFPFTYRNVKPNSLHVYNENSSIELVVEQSQYQPYFSITSYNSCVKVGGC